MKKITLIAGLLIGAVAGIWIIAARSTTPAPVTQPVPEVESNLDTPRFGEAVAMTNLAAAIQALYPNAISLEDFIVTDDGRGNQQIVKWKTSKLGAQPAMSVFQNLSQQNITASTTARIIAENRALANGLKDLPDADGVKWRAMALMLLDELNGIRGWTVSFKAEVASSTNLADLKTRVAGLPTLSDRTLNQAKSAYTGKINAGSAD